MMQCFNACIWNLLVRTYIRVYVYAWSQGVPLKIEYVVRHCFDEAFKYDTDIKRPDSVHQRLTVS